MMWVTAEGQSKFFAGYQPFVNMCVGGVNRAGQPAENDLNVYLGEIEENYLKNNFYRKKIGPFSLDRKSVV